jgi:hypothetical protein
LSSSFLIEQECIIASLANRQVLTLATCTTKCENASPRTICEAFS